MTTYNTLFFFSFPHTHTHTCILRLFGDDAEIFWNIPLPGSTFEMFFSSWQSSSSHHTHIEEPVDEPYLNHKSRIRMGFYCIITSYLLCYNAYTQYTAILHCNVYYKAMDNFLHYICILIIYMPFKWNV